MMVQALKLLLRLDYTSFKSNPTSFGTINKTILKGKKKA